MMTCCELYYFSAFMTESALLSAAIVAMILSVTSTIDFILSFTLPFIMEIVRMPWGKYRSWLLVAPIGVVIFGTLFFVRVSENEMVSAIFIIVAFVVAHLIWSMGEAAVNSMSLVMTDDIAERGRLSIWLGRGSMGNTLFFGLLASPILGMFAGNKYAYAILALIMELLYLVFFWILFFRTKGCDVTPPKGQRSKSNLGVALKYSFTNPNLIATMVLVMGTYCYMITQSGSMFYWVNYTLSDASIIAKMSLIITIISVFRLGGSFIVVPAAIKIFKGNKQRVAVAGFFGVAVFLIGDYLLNPAPMAAIILMLISCAFSSMPLAMWQGLYSDCAVYSEYKSGKDVKGFVMSLSIMPVKLGITLKSYIISAVLVSINYSATAVDTSAYPSKFAALYLLIPGAICAFCGIFHLLVYRLNEAKVADMQKEIEARKVA